MHVYSFIDRYWKVVIFMLRLRSPKIASGRWQSGRISSRTSFSVSDGGSTHETAQTHQCSFQETKNLIPGHTQVLHAPFKNIKLKVSYSKSSPFCGLSPAENWDYPVLIQGNAYPSFVERQYDFLSRTSPRNH